MWFKTVSDSYHLNPSLCFVGSCMYMCVNTIISSWHDDEWYAVCFAENIDNVQVVTLPPMHQMTFKPKYLPLSVPADLGSYKIYVTRSEQKLRASFVTQIKYTSIQWTDLSRIRLHINAFDDWLGTSKRTSVFDSGVKAPTVVSFLYLIAAVLFLNISIRWRGAHHRTCEYVCALQPSKGKATVE